MKRIVLNDRDEKIIEFLKEYKCANTSSLAAIFFNGSKRPCSRRLKNLREHGFINSSQEFVCLEQIHYVGKKPTQLKHSTILTNFIAKLYQNNIDILKSKVEFKIENVRSDLLLVCKIQDKTHIFFIEVCNTKKFDVKKYIKLKESNSWRNIFPVFPGIIAISDKPVEKHKDLNIITMDLQLNDFDKLKE